MIDIETRLSSASKERVAALEAEVTPIIARRLDEFARALDRKIPELITREEFEKMHADISTKLHYIEAPDVTPLQKRMDSVEVKLDKLTAVLKEFLNRMPVVVE